MLSIKSINETDVKTKMSNRCVIWGIFVIFFYALGLFVFVAPYDSINTHTHTHTHTIKTNGYKHFKHTHIFTCILRAVQRQGRVAS